jgi:hydrogen peroxide-dependent heme synthase
METAHPPETLEGWYVLHQVYTVSRSRLRQLAAGDPAQMHHGAEALAAMTSGEAADGGWSMVVELVGSMADVMIVHFRPTLDALGVAQRELAALAVMEGLTPTYSFLSVTEAGMYHLTAQLAREAEARGGAVGDEAYTAAMSERLVSERDGPYVTRRLYPAMPDDKPYVCFYPMSKRRQTGQNWYTLSLQERSRLMQAHGAVGRRYAGRVVQVIAGAIGLDAWEWGVTLFAADPVEFKKIVTEMRFDEASALYGEFGAFYVGKRVDARAWLGGVAGSI